MAFLFSKSFLWNNSAHFSIAITRETYLTLHSDWLSVKAGKYSMALQVILQVIQILFNSWSLVINVDFGWCNSYPLLKVKCVFSISASRTNYEPYKTNSKSCHNGGKQYFCCSKCWFNPLILWPPRVTRQGVKLRLIQVPMRLNFSLWRPNPEN